MKLKTKNLKLITLLVLCLLSAVCSVCSATDWYVSESGSGAKNGTSVENAWAKAGIVWASILPGDTLYIIGKINYTQWDILAEGETDNYITVSGYDSNSIIDLCYERVSIDFSGPDAYGAYSMSTTFGSLTSVSYAAEWTTASGPVNWTQLTAENTAPDETWQAGSVYFDDTNDVFYWKPFDGSITGKTVSVSFPFVLFIEQSWVKLTNLKVYGGAIRTATQGDNKTHVWLDHLTLVGLANYKAISISSDYTRISYCTIYNQKCGMIGGADYVTVDHCTIYDMSNDADAYCIGMNPAQYWLVENNEMYNANVGINTYGSYINGNVIRYNNIHDIDASYSNGGVGWERGYGISMEGTIDAGCTRTGNYIYYNLIYSCRSVGEGVRAAGLKSEFYDRTNYVLNNTFYDCSPNIYLASTILGGVAQSRGGVFKNNISLSPSDSSGSAYQLHIEFPATVSDSVEFNNNCYYPNDPNTFKLSTSFYDFSGWKTAISSTIGADALSITGNPLLTNVDANDFSLTSTSPCINVGEYNPYQSYNGLDAIHGKDIGAYEFQEQLKKWARIRR